MQASKQMNLFLFPFEFFSQTFLDYYMSVGIDVEYPIAHTHTQNGLAESIIKHLQLIARLLLLRTKLLV